MQVEEDVRRMYLEGRERWTAVQLELPQFAAHCEKARGALGAALPRHGADLFLCCACAAKDPCAMRLFERQNIDVARAAIARINPDWEFVQETLQELWDKLLLRMPGKVAEYTGRGPVQAWVRVIAARTALDRCRAQRQKVRRELQLTEALTGQVPNPELELTQSLYAETFQRALKSAISELTSQERNVLRMHVLGHCNIDEIGYAYQVHRATAARWLDAIRCKIYDSVRRQLAWGQRLTESEFQSIARGLRSQLELNLSESVQPES